MKGGNSIAPAADKTENSTVPNSVLNRRKKLFHRIEKIALLVAIAVVIVVGYTAHGLFLNAGDNVLLVLNGIGIYIGYLLILKQLKIQHSHADKICSIFKKRSSCNDILGSPASKFAGVISWSEVGLGYFTSNMVLLVMFPALVHYLALINICALPYTLWSVWYQKFRAHIWCPLCLIVQTLLWAIFITDLSFGLIRWPEFALKDVLITACIYAIPFLLISLLVPETSTDENTKSSSAA
ncbi:MAG: vitamin K epoxide reductase family protein [Culturomica sp.]|jgi:hypothetical protein|nr:vitamin K epoxide reductase family protein [Culturomica sp.]